MKTSILIIIMALFTLVLSGCVPHDLDAEIKGIVEKNPPPEEIFSPYSGQKIQLREIVVKRGDPTLGREFSISTGEEVTTYYVFAKYGSLSAEYLPFARNYATLYLTLEGELPVSVYSVIELRESIDSTWWGRR